MSKEGKESMDTERWYVRVKVIHEFAQHVDAYSKERAIELIKGNALYWAVKGAEVEVVEARKEEKDV